MCRDLGKIEGLGGFGGPPGRKAGKGGCFGVEYSEVRYGLVSDGVSNNDCCGERTGSRDTSS